MKKLMMSLLLIWLCHFTNGLATVTAQLDQTQVAAGDNFRIDFTINDNATEIVPDFAPLQQNFEILGTSKSTQISIINGRRTTSTTWGVTLSAKNTGTLTIPALTFGNDKSNRLKIQVSKTATQTSLQANNAKVFLEVSVNQQHPYVQSQVLYQVKLYYSQRLSSGAISPPQAAQAVIIKLGDSHQYQQQKGGILYQVLEQNYAIFPQQSGQLTIAPPIFNGSVIENQTHDFDQLLFAVQRPLRAQAQPITLHVSAIPAAFTGKQWLPARDVSLTESWQGIEQTPHVGQPLTREIVIKALGLTAAQLPDLTLPLITGVNSYPDKTKTHNTKSQDTVEGERRLTVTYIPTQAGNITLPEIKVAWWNTQTNKPETAMLLSRNITIFPSLVKQTAPTPTPITHNSAIISTTPVKPATTVMHNTVSRLPWIIAISCIVLWLMTLLIWRYCHKKPAKTLPTSHSEQPLNKQVVLQQFQLACHKNQPQLARQMLLNLARARWPSHTFIHLGDLAKCDSEGKLNAALSELNAAIYAEANQSWDGSELWRAWQALDQHNSNSQHTKLELPSLYPQ